MLTLSLVHNLALLVALALIHGLLMRGFHSRTLFPRVISGLLFGGVAILGMMTPMRWAPGVIFDGRSIILCAAGLFGGPLAGVLAGIIAAAFRIGLGGAGALMGVAVILESLMVGIAAYFLRRRYPELLKPLPLYGLGLVVHILMVILMLLLPGGLSGAARQQVALPVILLYPLAFMLVGTLFGELENHFLMAGALQASQARNQAFLGALPDMMFLFSADGRIVDFQTRQPNHLLMPPEQFLGRPVDTFLPPDLGGPDSGNDPSSADDR